MKQHTFSLLVCLAFLFQGCEKENEPPGSEPAGEVYELIQLSGSGVESSVEISKTRALDDFPNSKQIGVVAAMYNGGTVNWTSYDDINNATAIATREQGGTFYFGFSPVKYWPFDGSNLVFLAYSPAASAENGITLEPSRTVLDIQLTADTPDVMYASNNPSAATHPYSKMETPVPLGEFRHALSQLTVEVVADETMNPDVRLESLIIETTATSATLDLLQVTGAALNGLTVNPASATPFRYTQASSTTIFVSPYSTDVMVIPGSEGQTTLTIRLSDGVFDFERAYAVTAFTNITSGNTITFQQGVNTTLRFTVTGTLVDHPDDAIYLQGQLTDWIVREPLGVTID
ncbi:MAG: fimbrillin family protein [Tannerellaceae bacterium]|nr:fimbrillin family protein [Tannerellaceae bacterium]